MVLALLLDLERAASDDEHVCDHSVEGKIQLTCAVGVASVYHLLGAVLRARLDGTVMDAVFKIRVGAQAHRVAGGAALDLGEHALDTELLRRISVCRNSKDRLRRTPHGGKALIALKSCATVIPASSAAATMKDFILKSGCEGGMRKCCG